MIDDNQSTDSQGSETDELLQKKEFGTRLRIAREKLGMSVNEVAETLLISSDIIKALENSQADALPALTFTQGYIRSYARILDLSADEIIRDYVSTAPDSKQVLTPNSVLPSQKSSNDRLVKTFSVLFIVCAVSVLMYWVYSTDFSIATKNASHQAELKLFTKENIEVIEENEPDVSVEENVNNEFISDEPVTENNSQNDSVINESVDVGSEVTVVEAEELIVQSNVDELILTAISESWCEIEDSQGQRLYYQLLKSGEEIKLQGTAPFKVFLGNAPDVRVEINKKIISFDHLIKSSSNVVSMKIESDAQILGLTNR